MTPVTQTQVYLSQDDLDALHRAAKRSKRSVASLVREAVRIVWVRGERRGPVALWQGNPQRPSIDHDSIYDEP